MLYEKYKYLQNESMISDDVLKMQRLLHSTDDKLARASAVFFETILVTAFKHKGSNKAGKDVKTGVQKVMGDLAGGKYKEEFIHRRLIEEASVLIG